MDQRVRNSLRNLCRAKGEALSDEPRFVLHDVTVGVGFCLENPFAADSSATCR